MMNVSFEIQETFPVSPERIFDAWLDSESHSAMTGGKASCSSEPGAAFSAWDGYIQGKNLELVPPREIRQFWRTSEFAETDEDSLLVITLEEVPEGCLLRLSHSHIPEGQPDYKQGWENHYFQPMREYFQAEK